MRLFSRDGNSPTNRGAGDAEVLQPAFHETDDLVAPRFRLDESRILAVKIEQRLFECGEFKEVVFFGESFERAPAIGTVVAGLGIIHKSVVVDAVLAGVMALVDVAVLAAKAEEPLHGTNVPQVGGADKFIGGESELVP